MSIFDAFIYETVNNQGFATGRASGAGTGYGSGTVPGGKKKQAHGRAAGDGAARATGLRGSAGFASASGQGGADGAAAPLISVSGVGFASGAGHAAAPSVAGVVGFAPVVGDAAAEYNFEAESYGLTIGSGDAVAIGPNQAVGRSVGNGDALALASGATFATGAANAAGNAQGYATGDTASLAQAASTGDADGVGQAGGPAAIVDADLYEPATALDQLDAAVISVEVPVDIVAGRYYPPHQRPFPVVGRGYGILPQLEGEAHGVVGAVGRSAAQVFVRAHAAGAIGQTGNATVVLKGLSVAGNGAVGMRGSGAGVIVKFSGSATGRHDDDEAAVIAFLLAA